MVLLPDGATWVVLGAIGRGGVAVGDPGEEDKEVG